METAGAKGTARKAACPCFHACVRTGLCAGGACSCVLCLLGSAGSSGPSRAAPGRSLCPCGDAFQEDTELGEASGEVQLD